ncbi:Tox-REase-5 domain-containing protein [Collimonas silvisoli]|uniref:Tox-REase-5 domain-containing protein n=1 Tax=Collimonas silvisoli TaxID=2825884 RepID=UPI001E3DD024|nr:Tox-REase-5 domain-containing protein [Collimonas silvisoli]
MAGVLVPIGEVVVEAGEAAWPWVSQALKRAITKVVVDKVAEAAKTEANDDACKQGDTKSECKKCLGEKNGMKFRRARNMGAPINAEYQIKIANMNSGRRIGFGNVGNFIDEWVFRMTDFDGLWPDDNCTLVEAKGQYAQFLEPKKFEKFGKFVFIGLKKQAGRHIGIVATAPGVHLQWHFMEQEAWRKFASFELPVLSFYTYL